jgi:pimeloyl-ACP methyl ester carboxylesterase
VTALPRDLSFAIYHRHRRLYLSARDHGLGGQHTHNARFDFIDGCGHLPFLVEAKEYNRLLEDFLLN